MTDQCYMPKTMQQLHEALSNLTPESAIIAGGTDLVIALNSGKKQPDCFLYPGFLPGICEIKKVDGEIVIGAMVTMTDLEKSELISREMTAVSQSAAHVGSKQIRNRATLGGNIANASPACDLLPALWLFETTVTIAGPDGVRTVPLNEIVLGPGRHSLAFNEIIIEFRSKPVGKTEQTAYKKLGSRKEVTISRVGVGVRLNFDGNCVSACSVVAGAVSTKPVRVTAVEEILCGSKLEPERLTAAGEAMSDFILDINQRPNRIYKAWASKGVLRDALTLLTH